MTTRRPRSNNPQHTPRAGAGSSAPRSVDASAYSRSAYGSRGSSRVAASGLGSQQARSTVPNGNSRPPRAVQPNGSTRPSHASTQPSGAQVVPPPSALARPSVGAKHPTGTTAMAPRSSSEAAQYSRNSSNYGNGGRNGGGKNGKRKSVNQPKKRMSKGTKISIIVLLVLLAVLIGGVIGFYKFISSVNNELAGGKSEEELLAIQDSLVAREDLNEPFYVLLIGSDARSNENIGERSDTNIVVRVDPTTNTATMISIPRDTKIVYKGSTMKFNAAYAYDGAAGPIRAASDLLDIEISHYAEVNFESLIDLVDVLGGVEVDVPKRIDDWKAGDVVIEAGPQTLNGEAALVFARSRAYADGDFARASNQRLLIESIVNKVLSMPVEEIPGVVQAAAKCVSTDMTASDIFSLAMAFVDDDGDITIYSSMVPSSLTMINEVSYVVADQSGLRKVMEAVEAGEDPSLVETSGITSSSLDKKKEE